MTGVADGEFFDLHIAVRGSDQSARAEAKRGCLDVGQPEGGKGKIVEEAAVGGWVLGDLEGRDIGKAREIDGMKRAGAAAIRR